MIENHPAITQSREKSGEKQTGFRSPRSIRFLDTEGMNAAELVHHAAVSFVVGKFTGNSEVFLPEIAAQIECIYRGVYLLSTLERDEILREGREEELEKNRQRRPRVEGRDAGRGAWAGRLKCPWARSTDPMYRQICPQEIGTLV